MSGVEQIGTGGADGNQFPNTKIGFFGATPVAKQTVTLTTATATTGSNEAAIQQVINAGVNLGLWAQSGP